MVRGLERQAIFRTEEDRRDFVDRLAKICDKTGLAVLGWALLPNHFHLLVRTGQIGTPSNIPHRGGSARLRRSLGEDLRQDRIGSPRMGPSAKSLSSSGPDWSDRNAKQYSAPRRIGETS